MTPGYGNIAVKVKRRKKQLGPLQLQRQIEYKARNVYKDSAKRV